MIRRDATKENGQPVWLLIAQSEHASLASFLACHWAEFPGLSKPAQEQLLAAILSHDNGWDVWEKSPELDLEHGRPYQFTEMPGTTVLPIWTRSIDACESLGPLAGYAASGHFSALLEHHRVRLTAANDRAEAERFLGDEAKRRARCEAAWRSKHGDGEAAALQLAVGYLQSFDAISLWFCCAPRDEPFEIAVPLGSERVIRFSPRKGEAAEIVIAPWPLSVPTAELTAEAELVLAVKYKNREAFVAAPAERTLLSWRLAPPEPTVSV